MQKTKIILLVSIPLALLICLLINLTLNRITPENSQSVLENSDSQSINGLPKSYIQFFVSIGSTKFWGIFSASTNFIFSLVLVILVILFVSFICILAYIPWAYRNENIWTNKKRQLKLVQSIKIFICYSPLDRPQASVSFVQILA